VDKNTGDFVVIELKVGKVGDSAIGQILRYMGYVKANILK
jgi:RecB family endonuclease NucS